MKILHLVFNLLAFILAESSLIKKGLVSFKLFLTSDLGLQGFQIANVLCFFSAVIFCSLLLFSHKYAWVF